MEKGPGKGDEIGMQFDESRGNNGGCRWSQRPSGFELLCCSVLVDWRENGST